MGKLQGVLRWCLVGGKEKWTEQNKKFMIKLKRALKQKKNEEQIIVLKTYAYKLGGKLLLENECLVSS